MLGAAASGLIGIRRRRPEGRGRRLTVVPAVVLLVSLGAVGSGVLVGCGQGGSGVDVPKLLSSARPGSALDALANLTVRGRAPKTGYARSRFGPAWEDVDHNGCDTRDDILRRDLTAIRTRPGTRGCVVVAGVLADPYTGARLVFAKSAAAAVQIDHVVALSDAWQTGAQGWTATTRLDFANDPLNLLAVDGPANQQKGDGDAATWLPPSKPFRCPYVSRQIAVKLRYGLSVTPAERDASAKVLGSCPDQALPG